MKKTIAWMMAILMILTAAGCTGTGKSGKNASGSAGGTAQTSEAGTGTTSRAQESSAAPQPKEATIEETVLMDDAGVKITAKSLNLNGFFGPELALLIENNSEKNLTVQARKASVNGYMVETMMSVEVAAGKKASDSLTFTDSSLKEAGIEAIADMEFSFHIFTSDDWKEYLDTEMISVKTSLAEGFNYVYDDSGEVVFEKEGIRIVSKGLSAEDSLLGKNVLFYIENKGEMDITVQVRDVSVNGFMVETIFSCNVSAGKRAVDAVTLMNSDLEKNDIKDITEIELSFHVFDADNWLTTIDSDPVTLTFGE